MSDRRTVVYDPLRGIHVEVDLDADAGDGFVVHQVQRTAGLQARNDHEANEYRAGSMIGDTQRHMLHVAEIPVAIVHDLMNRGIWRDDKAMRRWLNDPDNRCFRTGGGRV